MVAVPYAIAATAWAPPTRKSRVTPETWHAPSVHASISPVPRTPGEQTNTSRTPATRAGIAVMSTDDG